MVGYLLCGYTLKNYFHLVSSVTGRQGQGHSLFECVTFSKYNKRALCLDLSLGSAYCLKSCFVLFCHFPLCYFPSEYLFSIIYIIVGKYTLPVITKKIGKSCLNVSPSSVSFKPRKVFISMLNEKLMVWGDITDFDV